MTQGGKKEGKVKNCRGGQRRKIAFFELGLIKCGRGVGLESKR